MSDRQQRSVGGEAQRRRLRDNAGLLASGLAHTLLLLGIILIGSPRLFATTPPQTIVVEIVRPEELAKGELRETAAAKQTEPQPQQQAAQQQPQPQQPTQPQQQAQLQQQAQTQQQTAQKQTPVKVASAAPATPVFTSLYPWPVGQPGGDVQEGDYRTFESMGKLEHNELAQFKARLKECWHPPAAGGPKLRAALRVAFRIDGSLAGSPELVEVSASPDALALVTSAKQALAACGPYNFLPADSYDTWRSLSLTFSPEDIAVAAVMK